MRTLYLKTDTEQDMIDVLTNYGFYTEDGWSTVGSYNDRRIDLDILGTITRIVSATLDDVVTETLPGFHANLLWNDDDAPEDIQSIMIPTPTTPERIFFGIG